MLGGLRLDQLSNDENIITGNRRQALFLIREVGDHIFVVREVDRGRKVDRAETEPGVVLRNNNAAAPTRVDADADRRRRICPRHRR